MPLQRIQPRRNAQADQAPQNIKKTDEKPLQAKSAYIDFVF
jgi:hypothetical protein